MKFFAVVVCLASAMLLQAQTTPPTPRPAPAPTAAQRMRAMAEMQELLIMAQNTAVWTPQGLLVLQGNRLLHYSPTLQLVKQVTLPLPPAPAPTTTGVTPAPVIMRNRIIPRLLPIDGGVILIRGTQVLRFDTDLNVVNQATLPELPPLTPAETAALCPICTLMQSMAMGMPGMPAPPAPPASPAPPSGTGTAR